MATLDLEREQQLLTLFPEPVRLHLLYKATQNNSSMKVDDVGQFIAVVYLSSGRVRGAYVSKPQDESEDSAFLFDVTTTNVTRFSPEVQSKVTFTSSISFGDAFVLSRDYISRKYGWTVKFSSDEVFDTEWEDESFNTVEDAKLKDVELYCVRSIGDLLPCPWREMSWEEWAREELRESFLSHKVVGESVTSARVLLLGPSGAGKSSFINSVRSVMFKRITHVPVSGPETPDRFKKLKSCSIRSGRGAPPTSLTMCDVMALGEAESAGLSVSDALAVVKGHVPEGYRFQADQPISSQTSGYRADPGLRDKIHGVLFVLDACKVTCYSTELQKTMRSLQAEISDLDVPQLVLLTHVDQVCHAVQEDVEYVYRSRTVRDKMHKAAEFLDMPVCYVLPVKNYATELSTSCTSDILLLTAVDAILQAVDDTLDNQCADITTTTAG